jgi:hypothetical protein
LISFGSAFLKSWISSAASEGEIRFPLGSRGRRFEARAEMMTSDSSLERFESPVGEVSVEEVT